MAGTTHYVDIVTRFSSIGNPLKMQKAMTQTVESLNGAYDRVTTTVGLLNNKTGKFTAQMQRSREVGKRFQMQWLSILFAGMALNRTMNGLVKTSLEWMGITELMSTTLGVVFLPIAEALLEVLLPIMDWFMNLDPNVQKAIGAIVIFTGIIGGILSVVGQVALGLAGISWLGAITGIGGVGTAAEGATGKVGGLLGALKNVAGTVLIAVSIGLIFSSIKEEDVAAALAKIFGGGLAAGVAALLLGVGAPAAIAIGALVALVGLTIKFNFDSTWKDGVDNFFKGIKDKIQNWLDLIQGYGLFKGTGLAFSKPDVSGFTSTMFTNPNKNMPNNLLEKDIFGNIKPPKNDFIFRPGQGATPINPNDTVVGYKGESPMGANINITYNISGVADKSDIERMLRENNNKLVEDVKRQMAV